jgi:hypothetical protein
MREQFPKSAVVYYRHGVALAELQEFEAADAAYAEAERVLDQDKNIPPNHWLRRVLHRHRGFLCWHRSKKCEANEKGIARRLELLVEAYRCTEKSLALTTEGALGYITATNNLLFYVIEYRHFLPSEQEPILSDDCITKHVPALERHLDIAAATRKELFRLDTLARSYIYMKDFEKAVLVAERIEHVLASPAGADAQSASYFDVTTHLNEQEREMLDHALWLVIVARFRHT